MVRILIIEDEDTDYLAMTRTIAQLGAGIQTQQVKSKEAAVAILEDQVFDCIVLDYMLPDGTGLELLEQLEAMGITSPILFATAMGEEIVATKAINSGAQNYFPKDKLVPESDLFLKCVINALEMGALNKMQKQLETKWPTLSSIS